jgi:hypothetical protein
MEKKYENVNISIFGDHGHINFPAALVFIALLWYAATYHDWNAWVVIGMVISFIGAI